MEILRFKSKARLTALAILNTGILMITHEEVLKANAPSKNYGAPITQFFGKLPANDGSRHPVRNSGTGLPPKNSGAGPVSKGALARAGGAPPKPMLDNFLLSQDLDDACLEVVWANSPEKFNSNIREDSSGYNRNSQEAGQQPGGSSSQQSKEELKQSLIRAVQKQSNKGSTAGGGGCDSAGTPKEKQGDLGGGEGRSRDGGTLPECGGGSEGGPFKDALLESSAAEGLAAMTDAVNEHPWKSHGDMLDLMLLESPALGDERLGTCPDRLGGGGEPEGRVKMGVGDEVHPASAPPTAGATAASADGGSGERFLQQVLSMVGSSGGRHLGLHAKSTTASKLMGSCSGSAKRGNRGGLRTMPSAPGGGSMGLGGRARKHQPASGQKRKALLELLDQVELMVKSRASSEGRESPEAAVGPPSRVVSTGATGLGSRKRILKASSTPQRLQKKLQTELMDPLGGARPPKGQGDEQDDLNTSEVLERGVEGSLEGGSVGWGGEDGVEAMSTGSTPPLGHGWVSAFAAAASCPQSPSHPLGGGEPASEQMIRAATVPQLQVQGATDEEEVQGGVVSAGLGEAIVAGERLSGDQAEEKRGDMTEGSSQVRAMSVSYALAVAGLINPDVASNSGVVGVVKVDGASTASGRAAGAGILGSKADTMGPKAEGQPSATGKENSTRCVLNYVVLDAQHAVSSSKQSLRPEKGPPWAQGALGSLGSSKQQAGGVLGSLGNTSQHAGGGMASLGTAKQQAGPDTYPWPLQRENLALEPAGAVEDAAAPLPQARSSGAKPQGEAGLPKQSWMPTAKVTMAAGKGCSVTTHTSSATHIPPLATSNMPTSTTAQAPPGATNTGSSATATIQLPPTSAARKDEDDFDDFMNSVTDDDFDALLCGPSSTQQTVQPLPNASSVPTPATASYGTSLQSKQMNWASLKSQGNQPLQPSLHKFGSHQPVQQVDSKASNHQQGIKLMSSRPPQHQAPHPSAATAFTRGDADAPKGPGGASRGGADAPAGPGRTSTWDRSRGAADAPEGPGRALSWDRSKGATVANERDVALSSGVDPMANQLLGKREEIHHVVLEVDMTSTGKTLKLFNEYQLLGKRKEIHHVVFEVEVTATGKTLKLFNEYKGTELIAHLHHMWADLDASVGDNVNVVGGPIEERGGQRHIRFDCDSTALLVLHPDVLLSGTVVTTAMKCSRQAWLQERLTGGSGDKAVLGNLSHELLQTALRMAVKAPVSRESLVEEGGQGHGPGGKLDMGPNSKHGPTTVRVCEVVDIEENIWAPLFGLKGQIDATLRVELSTPKPTQMQAPPSWGGRAQPSGHHMGSTSGGNRDPPVFKGSAGQQQQLGPTGRGKVFGPSSGGQQGSRPHPWQADLATRPQLHLATSATPSDEQVRSALVPFEYKSGKDFMGHRVSLYLLLIEERYKNNPDLGLLWNVVQRAPGELAALMLHRNRLATHLAGPSPTAPPMIQDDFQCSRCFQASACTLHHKAVEGGNAESSGMTSYTALTAHLSPAHTAFFAHWTNLLTLEESAGRAARPSMWTQKGAEREAAGKCVARLKLVGIQESASSPEPYIYTLTRHHSGLAPTDESIPEKGCSTALCPGAPTDVRNETNPGQACTSARVADVHSEVHTHPQHAPSCTAPSDTRRAGAPHNGEEGGEGSTASFFGSCTFGVGDMVLLGIEGRYTAYARVTVSAVTQDTIEVVSKKSMELGKLSQQLLSEAGQVQRYIPAEGKGTLQALQALSWRIDKDESESLSKLMRSNLVQLMAPPHFPGQKAGDMPTHGSPEASNRLRKLIVDLESPVQGGRLPSGTAPSSSDDPAENAGPEPKLGPKDSQGMNLDQREAVQRVLEMQDYGMILGMPGTGKTTTIVRIIQALISAGRSVLLTSYTNSAVDNILIKLAAEGVPFLRLGHAKSVHPAVKDWTPGGARYPCKSVSALQDLTRKVRVLACTCLSSRHSLLAHRTFDVCIVDEASQISVPAVLGPLMLARTFLLVGDHYQLNPLVTNPEAQRQGYGTSLFRRLSEAHPQEYAQRPSYGTSLFRRQSGAHPQAVVTLRRQYRMAADIMLLSNRLVYNGVLQCGSDEVAMAKLNLPHYIARCNDGSMPQWLKQALDPNHRVVYVNTSNIDAAREVMLRDAVSNPSEATLVGTIVEALLSAGLKPTDLGLISPYRAQVTHLKTAISKIDMSLCQAKKGVAADTSDVEATPSTSDIEVLTVDKYQGRDKPCIIMSLVRSNAAGNCGRLLADWQRVNVALTRAKAKIILLGCTQTLASIPMLASLADLVVENGWMLDLPHDCLDSCQPGRSGG
eukprot:gene15376-21461_t